MMVSLVFKRSFMLLVTPYPFSCHANVTCALRLHALVTFSFRSAPWQAAYYIVLCAVVNIYIKVFHPTPSPILLSHWKPCMAITLLNYGLVLCRSVMKGPFKILQKPLKLIKNDDQISLFFLPHRNDIYMCCILGGLNLLEQLFIVLLVILFSASQRNNTF